MDSLKLSKTVRPFVDFSNELCNLNEVRLSGSKIEFIFGILNTKQTHILYQLNVMIKQFKRCQAQKPRLSNFVVELEQKN